MEAMLASRAWAVQMLLWLFRGNMLLASLSESARQGGRGILETPTMRPGHVAFEASRVREEGSVGPAVN